MMGERWFGESVTGPHNIHQNWCPLLYLIDPAARAVRDLEHVPNEEPRGWARHCNPSSIIAAMER
jgi:hypothetical protein